MDEKQEKRNLLKEIKTMDKKALGALADELREKIIKTVAKNGGHLASNLGMVEATIALHKVFDSPNDKIIFDVGHQCYAHKLITGREDSFDTLRQSGGISGFTNRKESEHDILNEGHSGTALSGALGIAEANKIKGNNNYTIAVVGDGSLTNGMVYEALNNCAEKKLKLILLINDNEMSISKNVGGLDRYFSKIRVSNKYFRLKRGVDKGLSFIPLIGKLLARGARAIKDFFKRVFVRENFFEDLGLIYIGPVDGNNIEKLSIVLNEAKKRETCTVIHMQTKKGKGYELAEKEPDKYHGVGSFDAERGVESVGGECFSSHMGNTLSKLAEKDDKICAITAAMAHGTGLDIFEGEHPERFFDVGIAEEHAITFASGLSVNGMKSVVALYSTFAQRVYDQLMHDVAIQGLPLTLLLDRCGLVANDGITHQGIFDYPVFTTIPNTKIYAPETYSELDNMLSRSINDTCLSIVRYPRGSEKTYTPPVKMEYNEEKMWYVSDNIDTAQGVIITYGRMGALASDVVEKLKDKNIAIIRLLKIFPIDYSELRALTANAKWIYVLEESFKTGGLGEKLSANLDSTRVRVHAIEDFVEHGSLESIMKACKFTTEDIIEEINKI